MKRIKTIVFLSFIWICTSSNCQTDGNFTIQVKICNLLTNESVSVSNLLTTDSIAKKEVEFPYLIPEEGGVFSITLRSLSEFFVLGEFILTIQNKGNFSLFIMNDIDSNNVTINGNEISGEGTLKFRCSEIQWELKTLSTETTLIVMLFLSNLGMIDCR